MTTPVNKTSALTYIQYVFGGEHLSMTWPSNFYKRRKNPWIGFILVLLFAPFGFLYNSWKTALAVFFVIGPLWIVFLRHTRFDLIDNPWAHYIALLLLAAFAALQISGQNHRIAADTAPTKGIQVLGGCPVAAPN